MSTTEIARLLDTSGHSRELTAIVGSGAPNATMTFLFTDIEGSTRQWEESPEMHDRVERHFAALQTAVDSAGGEVFATMGDGIAAAFPSAESAVHAAISAQRRMPAVGLSVRMGIHSGEVERVGDDFRGRPVNRAARIMAVGHGGQILVSDVSAALVRTGPRQVEFVDLGTHRLRDLAEPERQRFVEAQAQKRADVQAQIRALADQREGFLSKEREKAGAEDGFDSKVLESLSEQAAKNGIRTAPATAGRASDAAPAPATKS
jgi:class 3 adenylate cyclase